MNLRVSWNMADDLDRRLVGGWVLIPLPFLWLSLRVLIVALGLADGRGQAMLLRQMLRHMLLILDHWLLLNRRRVLESVRSSLGGRMVCVERLLRHWACSRGR